MENSDLHLQPQFVPFTSSHSRSSNKQISQAYKQATELFLTRRLQEALSVLEPIVTPLLAQDTQEQTENGDSQSQQQPPIVSASCNSKTKIWNLYITIHSAVIDLGPEEGKNQFGHKEWKAIATRVREGEIWDNIVRVGYGGREGSLDPETVCSLSMLLLKHSASQKLNQERLENYLSNYGQPDLDVVAHLQSPSSGKRRQRFTPNGTNTPKDLAGRVKVIEVFTLHVLPRNDEWEYAQEFISLSEVLDEDTKESWLHALETQRQEQERIAQRAAGLQIQKDEEFEQERAQLLEEERLSTHHEEREDDQEQIHRISSSTSTATVKPTIRHTRSSSEVDYGIEKSNPNPTKTRSPKPALKKSSPSASAPSKQRKTPTGSKNQPIFVRQLRILANLLVSLVKNIGHSLSSNPLVFLRTLLLVLGFLMALRRPVIRDRIRRVTATGWQKVRGTVGMGVKVSYI
ncbi:hypothetical protein FQN57_003718 [Myotisia sp. PD_48]|nr:hypothetical protein FQN57_003718 [Myotisia sp. PD_48]